MCSRVLNVAVLASGGGSNLQSLIDAMESNFFKSQIKLVISNKYDAFALKRAKSKGIEAMYINDDSILVNTLVSHDIDIVVLAGYLKILGEDILTKYDGKIINIHPSLLPKYGGRGMYGIHVHEAVFEAGEKTSGATVHYVTSEIDGGEVIIQKSVNIGSCKNPKEIQTEVLKIEHEILKKALLMLEKGYIDEKSAN